MTALWMAYALVVSLLLAAAARVGEEGLDLLEWPIRWAWIGAIAGAVAVPVLAYAAVSGWPVAVDPPQHPGGVGPAAAGEGGTSLFVPPVADLPGTVGAELVDGLRGLDGWLLGGWAAASALTAGWLLVGWLRLRLRRRSWEAAEIDGVDVLVSPDEGPAITGFLQGRILLPSWFEELDRDLRPLVLRHEREHLAVGDHRLLAAGLAAVVLFPWNPVLWWCLARLRQAMEIDCDRRVLEDGVDRAAYGELLVQVGERAAGPPLSPAAFADASSFLERRIRCLAGRRSGAGAGRAVAAAAVAVVLGGSGGWVPVPDGPVEVPGGATESTSPAAAVDGAAGPEARGGDRPTRVVPPAPAVMKLNLRLYRADDGDDGTSRSGAPGQEGELDMEAVRLAKRLSYACAPYLNGAGAGVGGPGRNAGSPDPGCFVAVDGEPTHPSVLGKLGSGGISSVRILPGRQAVARFGPEARRGAYVLRTAGG